jgi:hypothetical protein
MVSAYYEQSVVKADLGLSGSGLDTQLDDWSDKIESHINDLIHSTVSKARLLVTLPDVPLTGTAITETIKNAANAGVKGKYYEVEQRDLDRQTKYEKEMAFYIKDYIERLDVDKKIYGRLIR